MKRWLAVAGIVAVVAATVATLLVLRHGDKEPVPRLPGAAPLELAYLPSQFPSPLRSGLQDAEVSRSGGKLVVTLTALRSGEPKEAIFFAAERLRDAGWGVKPSADPTRSSFSGFGWEGNATAIRVGNKAQLTIVVMGKE